LIALTPMGMAQTDTLVTSLALLEHITTLNTPHLQMTALHAPLVNIALRIRSSTQVSVMKVTFAYQGLTLLIQMKTLHQEQQELVSLLQMVMLLQTMVCAQLDTIAQEVQPILFHALLVHIKTKKDTLIPLKV
jgi:hypothetical protein